MNKVCKTCGGFDICIMGHAGRTADCPEWRPKWIPVSEMLPENPGHYLCWVLYGGGYEGKGISSVYFRLDREWQMPVIDKVTHWMPLPEPPKEEE